MKLCLAFVLVAMVIGTPAVAADMDFSKIKCKEFISADKDDLNTMLAWLEGFYTKEDSAPILFGDKMKKDAKNLTDYCHAHGEDDMIEAAEAVMPVE